MNNNGTDHEHIYRNGIDNYGEYNICECGHMVREDEPVMSDIDRKTANEVLGLTETYHHDIDEKSLKCKKCAQHIKELKLKACPVVGVEEFKNYGK